MKMNVYFGNRAEAGPPRHTEDYKEKVDTAVALLKLYCFVKKNLVLCHSKGSFLLEIAS